MVERTWRKPMARPEQKPTVNITVTGIAPFVPRAYPGEGDNVFLEIAPGLCLHDTPATLDRLTAEARACVRSVQ